jgi:VCBS repeat-containing protein
MLKQDPTFGFWYWDNGSAVTNPAALWANDVGFLPTLGNSPPIADVVCPRSITFTLDGKPSATLTVIEDGGNLDFTLTDNATDKKSSDLSGLFFDLTHSKLSTLSVSGPQITQFVTGTGSVINLKNGVNLNGTGAPAFDVGMEFGLAGIGSDHQNIQSESFVLSDTAHDLSIDDLHPAGETGNVGVRDLSSGQKLVAVAPYAPKATPDVVTTLEDASITISVSALATDLNSGATLTIGAIGSGAQGPQYGTVTVAADGQSLTYTPTTLDYKVDGILTGNQDAFQVCVHDSLGGEVTSFVTVNATPVADAPTVGDTIAAPHAGDPATLIRFGVTVTSGDFATINQGSDYIQSLALSLTGTNTSGITITDSAGLYAGGLSGLITPPCQPGAVHGRNRRFIVGWFEIQRHPDDDRHQCRDREHRQPGNRLHDHQPDHHGGYRDDT